MIIFTLLYCVMNVGWLSTVCVVFREREREREILVPEHHSVPKLLFTLTKGEEKLPSHTPTSHAHPPTPTPTPTQTSTPQHQGPSWHRVPRGVGDWPKGALFPAHLKASNLVLISLLFPVRGGLQGHSVLSNGWREEEEG